MKKIVILILALAIAYTNSHECVHEKMQSEVEIMNSPLPSERNLLGIADVTPQPIRIHFDTRLLANLETKYKDYIEQRLLKYTKQFFEKRLKVRRDTGPIKFSSYASNCYKVPIPQEHKDNGVDADLVVYVTWENSSSESFTAWATTCLRGSGVNGRPLAGQINFNIHYLSLEAKAFEAQIGTILHETTHILAFSSSHYGDFVDGKGNKRTNVYESITWREVSKAHFKCDTIKGMELENQGGSGTLGSHWERTILHNEVMTGSRIDLRAYTKFTMAVLEDSGWYVPNYQLLEPFFWGQNKGCDFIDKGCTGTNFPEFCTDGQTGCTYHRNANGYCSSDSMADSCKYMRAFSNGLCQDKANYEREYYGEVYGLKSKCFESSILSTTYVYSGNVKAKCYEYSCNTDHTTITITANNGKSGSCSKKGEELKIEGFNGHVVCPDPKDFCEGYYPNCPNYCSAHGYCINGKCECNPGHGGEDCSVQLNCKNSCNQKGICQVDGTCVCQQGYSGEDCSVPDCTIGCVNGKCEVPNKCTCNQGWIGNKICFICFLGEKCDVPVCRDNCNGNGKCISPDKCQCNVNWLGEFCDRANCKDKNDCSGNGLCNSPNNCACNDGYSVGCPNGCSIPRGACFWNKCYCWLGYYGDDCSKHNIF